jgi:AraC family transcriptional regulator
MTAADQFDDTPSPTDLQQFVDLANNLVERLETAKHELERDRAAAKASLATVSSILQSEIERRSRAKGLRPRALAAWQITRVRAFIDENLHRTIHAKDLSAVARRSTAHFSRSFKQVFGEPPHAYVVRRRLERACHLMITSSASLSEIALSVGFSDQAHLSRLFRQALGQSPSSWRRDHESRRGGGSEQEGHRMARSREGLTSKVHAVVGINGLPGTSRPPAGRGARQSVVFGSSQCIASKDDVTRRSRIRCELDQEARPPAGSVGRHYDAGIRTQAAVRLDDANFGAAFETDRACAATHDVGAD